MNKLLLSLILAVGLVPAAPIVTVTPAPSLASPPGSQVFFGFNITPDPDFDITFTSTSILTESNPLGDWFDSLAATGGPDGGLLPPGFGPWSSTNGLGYYQILPTSAPGATSTGLIRITWERSTPGDFNFEACQECLIDVPFSIRVTQPINATAPGEIPEPSTAIPLALLAAYFWPRRGSMSART